MAESKSPWAGWSAGQSMQSQEQSAIRTANALQAAAKQPEKPAEQIRSDANRALAEKLAASQFSKNLQEKQIQPQKQQELDQGR